MNIDYSVIIRTTGNAHEKYQALLDSINKLDPKPAEVIVVLPEDYALPQERLGYETFYYSKKGMVIQRLTGIKMCKTKYALICDDDISFETDYVRMLFKPIEEGIASFSAGPLISFFPPAGLNALICTVMGSAMPLVRRRKDKYVSVLKSTGYSYNRKINTKELEYYKTDSAPWTCFFADIEAFRKLDFDSEIWLDKHGYSALDDQTMFYKAKLMGYNTVIVSTAIYQHLDAKTSTKNNKSSYIYSSAFNRVVFWHRFIYSEQNNKYSKFLSILAFCYRIELMKFWEFLEIVRKKAKKEDYAILLNGFKDGKEYIKSKEYKTLPAIEKLSR